MPAAIVETDDNRFRGLTGLIYRSRLARVAERSLLQLQVSEEQVELLDEILTKRANS